MTISRFYHYTPLSSDTKFSRNWATKEDIEDLQEGLKRNFIRIDKLEKQMELHQEKMTLVLKKLVEYVDMKSQENNKDDGNYN